jgi:hypothetical protein
MRPELEMSLDEYRAAVIEAVACPACLVPAGTQCIRLPDTEFFAEVIRPGYLTYVHDDRSLAHLATFHCASCDGHSCE